MNQRIACLTLVIPDYDEAIAYYTGVLGFGLMEDSQLSATKRWVLVQPRGSGGPALLLAQAANPVQEAAIGNQTGGRVFLFLHTDDFDRDYQRYLSQGVEFIREPSIESYGKVSVFRDRYGNLWDLVEPSGH